MSLLEVVADQYGSGMEKVDRRELVLLLSAMSLELECREFDGTTETRLLEYLLPYIATAPDKDILTITIGVALKLRLYSQASLGVLIESEADLVG